MAADRLFALGLVDADGSEPLPLLEHVAADPAHIASALAFLGRALGGCPELLARTASRRDGE